MSNGMDLKKATNQVERQTNLLFSELETLDTELYTLRERLNKVIRAPEPMDMVEVNPKERPELVPLAETIREATSFVEKLTSRVRDILERLEL